RQISAERVVPSGTVLASMIMGLPAFRLLDAGENSRSCDTFRGSFWGGRRPSARSWRGVLDDELHFLASLPLIGAQMTCEMEALSLPLQQGRAKLAVETAESDGLKTRRAAAIGQDAANMLSANHIGAGDPLVGQGEARLGIAGAERSETRNEADELRRRRRGRNEPVDAEFANDAVRSERSHCAIGEKVAQLAETRGFDREACGHRMTAAVDQEPGLARRDHRGTEGKSGDRAAGALADAVRDGGHASGTVVAFLEAAGDDADDTWMPALAGDEEQRCASIAALDLVDRLRQHARLDLAPLAIERIKLLSDRARLDDTLARQQPRPQIRLPHPAACIDPRPQDESGVVAVQPLAQPRHIGKRRKA